MTDIKNDYSVKTYLHKGKTYYEVKVQQRDKFGKVKKRSSRFTKTGKRISSKTTIFQVKMWLRDEIKQFVDQKSIYTFQKWKDLCVRRMRTQGLKESTLKHYDGTLDRWKDKELVSKNLGDITREDIYRYFHSYLIKRGATDWTRKNIHKRIHRIFEMAVDEGEISRNPARGVKISVKTDDGVALTPSEVESLLTKAKLINHSYYPHWVVALLTGLRNGELFALRYEKIDFDSNTILINEQFTSKDGLHLPKKGKVRTIDLGPELKAFLLSLRQSIGPQKARLWRHVSEPTEVNELIGGRLTGRKIPGVSLRKDFVEYGDLVLPRIRSWTMGGQARVLRDFCKKIGIREAKFHDLRATHITNLLSNGVSISRVMHQVGHSKMSTTDAYHRLAGVEIKGITEKLSFDVPKINNEENNNVIPLFNKHATNS